MNTLKLSDILFAIRPSDLEICPGQRSNSSCPTSTPRSPKRGSRTRASQPPKFSKVAVDLAKVLNGKVAALWAKDGSFLYCEAVKKDGTIASFLYKAGTHELFTNEPQKADIPMLLWALHPNSTKFAYTREACSDMMKSIDPVTRIVQATGLGFVCECFYYDWVDELSAIGSSINQDELQRNHIEFVQQAIRTNNAEIIDTPFNDYLVNTFSNVSFTAPTTGSSPSITTLSDFFAKSKDGEFILPYEWNADQQSRIRPLSSLEDYIPNETYQKMAKVAYTRLSRVIDREHMGKTGLDAIKGDYINIILGGRPGTGKTTTADALSATLGLPIYTAKVTRNTEEDTFEGMTKADSEGKFVVHDTAFLKAYEHGGIVVLEEFNLADPGVMQGAIGQAVEYPFILNKDGYMEIRRHPMCIIIATMNTGTQGAREPNQALTSRFPITLTMNDPSESEFISILEKHGHKRMLCKKVYKAYTAILKYIKQTANDEEMALCVTMRHCLAALDMVDDEIVGTVREAIQDTMIGSIGLRDAELAEDVFMHAIKPLGGLD